MLKRIITLVALLSMLVTGQCFARSRIADIGCELMHQQLPTYEKTGKYSVGELHNYQNKHFSFKGYFDGQVCDIYLYPNVEGYVDLVTITDNSRNNPRALTETYMMVMAAMGIPKNESAEAFKQVLNQWLIRSVGTNFQAVQGFYETTLSNGKRVVLGYFSSSEGKTSIISISGL